jgi:hypothetical protein
MNTTKRLYLGFLAGLVLTIALGALAPQALAQSASQKIEIVGNIQAAASGTITVNGLIVNISGAEIKTALTVGRLVKVEGFLFEDGAIRAYEVDAAELDDDRDQLEIVGVLEAIAAGQMTVAGVVFDVSRAEVTRGLVVGDLVKVHASQSTTGQWVAREVERFVSGGDDSSNDSQDDSLTAISGCVLEIKVSSANLRTGPGMGYSVQGYVQDDEKYAITGVHSSGAWLQIARADGAQGWVAASVGELYGPCAGLSVSNVQFRGSDNDDRDDDSRGRGSDDDQDDNGRSSDDDHDDDRNDDSRGRGSDNDQDDNGRGSDDDHDDDRNDDSRGRSGDDDHDDD